MEWMLLPLKRYAEFSGRSRRKEYWMFVLFQVIVFSALILLALMFGGLDSLESGSDDFSAGALVFFGLIGLFALAILIPSIAVQIRRLHDTDKSGWWLLGLTVASMIPLLGIIASIVLLVFYCLDGTKGENRFGPDPKMEKNVGDVFE